MFKENTIIFLKAETLKALGSPSSKTRAASALNANAEAVPYNELRIARAGEELQRPILDAWQSIRSGISAALIDLPKAAVKKTAGVVTDVTTGAIALPANIARWAMDMVRLVPRVMLIGLDKATEVTAGNVSRIASGIRTKVHNTLGTTPAFAS